MLLLVFLGYLIHPLDGAQLSQRCLPTESGKQIPWLAFIVCRAVALPPKLFLSILYFLTFIFPILWTSY